jgi:hypothetical protein
MNTFTFEGVTYDLGRTLHSARRQDPGSGITWHWRFTGERTEQGEPLVTPVGTTDQDTTGSAWRLTHVIREEGPLIQPPYASRLAFELRLVGDEIPTWIHEVARFEFRPHARTTGAFYPLPDTTTLVIDPARFTSLRLLTDAELDSANTVGTPAT